MSPYRDRIRHATDEQLRAVAAFYDAPELRRYYAGLLEDIRCELQLRAAAEIVVRHTNPNNPL